MKRFKDECVFGFFGVILVLLGLGCASDRNPPLSTVVYEAVKKMLSE